MAKPDFCLRVVVVIVLRAMAAQCQPLRVKEYYCVACGCLRTPQQPAARRRIWQTTQLMIDCPAAPVWKRPEAQALLLAT
jgi:hypothetical protein